MAKSPPRKGPPRSRRWPLVLAVLALIAAGVAWYFRAPMAGYSQTAAAYSARVACSCRFVGGRSLEDCEKDKLSGMELVMLSENADAKSVTARFPLLASETAILRDGYGCVLEPWDG